MISVVESEYAPDLHQPRHAHDIHTVSLVLSGGLRERVGSREQVAGPLSIVVKPAGTEHEDRFGDQPTRLLRFVLTRELIDAGYPMTRHLDAWQWHSPSPVASAFLAVLREKRMPSSDEGKLRDTALDALAAIGAGYAAPPSGAPPRWLQLVRERVEDSEAVTTAALARDAKVHPVYLAREFRRWYGSSIRDLQRRRRAQRAAAALAASRGSISAASYRAGFADHAHMCRVFKGATGLTPAAYRELLNQ